MDENTSPDKPSLSSGLTLIEKAREIRWTLQLASAVLFADLFLVWRTDRDISQWSFQSDQILADAGLLVVAVLIFGVLMSIVMPLGTEIARQLGWQLLIHVPRPNWMRAARDFSRPIGAVLPGELYRYASKAKDPMALDVYRLHLQKQQAKVASDLAFGQLVFSTLLIGLIDFYADRIGLSGTTLLQHAVATHGSAVEYVLALGVILALLAIKVTWFAFDGPDWIIYPALYDEIEQKRR